MASKTTGEQPVTQYFSSLLELGKSTPNCIPRLCSLKLSKLTLLKPLDNDLSSMGLCIAVKMQHSKRVARTDEIVVPSSESPDTDLTELSLDFRFCLQYLHFLKKDGNNLNLMLQRKKKYKNRRILGYKTLAVGQVNMTQVLQCSMDRDLPLFSDMKEQTHPVAKLRLMALSSQPADHEVNGHPKHGGAHSDIDRSPDLDVDSDSGEGGYADYSSGEDMSDSEPTMVEHEARRKHSRGKTSRGHAGHAGVTQRNIKQKFRALLKRFKISEDVLTTLDSEVDQDQAHPADIDLDLSFDSDDSDSGPEIDTISVLSTPKPKLRPFFSGRGTTPETVDQILKTPSQEVYRPLEETPVKRSESDLQTPATIVVASQHQEVNEDDDLAASSSPLENQWTSDQDNDPPDSHHSSACDSSPQHSYPSSPLPRTSFPPHVSRTDTKEFIRDRIRSTSYREKKNKKEFHRQHRRNSVGEDNSLPRKALLDQLSVVFESSDDHLPDTVFLVSTQDWQGQMLSQKVSEHQLRLICTCTDADVKAAVNFLVTKIQKFCNNNARTPMPIKVGVVGGDAYFNTVLRPYVEHFSSKSPDWQNYTRFLVIPYGPSSIGKYIASLDSVFASLFMDQQWKDTFDKPESPKLDSQDIVNRISKYLSGANALHQMPIAEALIMFKGRNSDDTTQMFLPFLSEVRIGTLDNFNSSVEIVDEVVPLPSSLSSSPPASTPTLDKYKDLREGHTPPSSPNIGGLSSPPTSTSGSALSSLTSPAEYMDLQVDYWVTSPPKADSVERDKDKREKKDSNKCSLKTAFRALYANRLPHCGASSGGSGVHSSAFSMMVVTKEKKQKIMRIGKKGKDPIESKSQAIEGVSRMVCTSKSQNFKLKVLVDGVEWTGVKFFQLSLQWQTHVKTFPVAMFVDV